MAIAHTGELKNQSERLYAFKEWVFISLHMIEWFDIQQVLVVHVVLRSGYLFIYTGMV